MRPKLENTVPRFVGQSHVQFAGWDKHGTHRQLIPIRQADSRVDAMQLLNGLNGLRMDRRRSLLGQLKQKLDALHGTDSVTAMNRHYSRAFDLLASAAGREAFDLTRESTAVRNRYGRHPHGQSVLQARRLMERGVPLVTVFWPNDGIKNVSIYGDAHGRNFIDHPDRLMPSADQAFSAPLDETIGPTVLQVCWPERASEEARCTVHPISMPPIRPRTL